MRDEKLTLNDLAVSALRESAKWSLFLSIVGFIMVAFMLIAGIGAMAAFSSVPADAYGSGLGSSPFAAVSAYLGLYYIFLAVVYFFPIYYLYKYATGTKQALESGNDDVMANALANLKSHHKFLGIFTIIMLVIMVLALIGVFIFAASFASGGMH